jgi:O-antigen ligase
MRWLLLLPVFFLFRRYKLDWRFLSIGLSFGVFISVSTAFYQIYFLGLIRATGTMNSSITFGEIMVAVDIMLWILMVYAFNNKNKLHTTILFLASLMAFYGSLLAVTRGAWLVYMVFIIGFLIYYFKRSLFNISYLLGKLTLLRILMFCIVGLLVAQTDQYKIIHDRTSVTATQISEGSFNEASGGRIIIFLTAIEVFKEFPLGAGTNNFRNGAKAVIILDGLNNNNITIKNQNNEIVEASDISNLDKYLYLQSFNKDGSLRYTSRFRHAHNEWINTLAENGILGFILLTLIFIYPLKIFWKSLSHKEELVRIYSFSGILLTLSFFIFAQTQSIFTTHVNVIFYVFFIFLFLAQISRMNNLEEKLSD